MTEPQKFRVAFFSTRSYDREFFDQAIDRYDAKAGSTNELPAVKALYFEHKLNDQTYKSAEGCDCVCIFVNDTLCEGTLKGLKDQGVRLIALRCAGYNNVDLIAAASLGFTVVHVPAYSPNAVAEHALALVMALNRKIHKVINRLREGDFSLERLGYGFDLVGKTVGIIGMGKIGQVFAKIMNGLGCKLVAFSPYGQPMEDIVEYTDLPTLLLRSDIISLHCPLTDETRHIINKDTLAQMKKGAVLINTSRGALLDTKAVIHALKQKQLGALGLDVYEEEEHFFHHDLREEVIHDDVIARLLSFPNVIVTPHQGFFTKEALEEIAGVTSANIQEFLRGEKPKQFLVHEGQMAPFLTST